MKVLNPPKEIWLCVGEVDDGADFKDLATEEIGWCTDQMDEADVRYVLAPEAEKSLEQSIRKRLDYLQRVPPGLNGPKFFARELLREELEKILVEAGLKEPGAA